MKNIINKIKLAVITIVLTNSFFAQDNEDIICHEIDFGCLIMGREIIGEHVIKSNEEYQELLSSLVPISSCYNYILPDIDFNQYTLIGYISSESGCKPPIFSHSITKQNNQYFFNIDVNKQGRCKVNHTLKIWCLIPKIEETSVVTFNTQKLN